MNLLRSPSRLSRRTFAVCATLCFAMSAQTRAEEPAVKVVHDVAFLGEDRAEKMDLYLPAGEIDEPRPAILIVHGGGWQGGDKRAKREQNIGNHLASQGYVCASVNYRLAKKTEVLAERLRQVWPGNLQDCRTGVRFLRKHAERYGIDPDHIGAIGGSAGGHLTAMLAVTDETSDFHDEDALYGEYSGRIQAVVPMYGVHDAAERARRKGNPITPDDEELLRQASPITWVSKDDPPALILHGTKDELVPVFQSELLHGTLSKAKVPSDLIIIEGAPHSFHLQPKQRDLRDVVTAFFDLHLKRK